MITEQAAPTCIDIVTMYEYALKVFTIYMTDYHQYNDNGH